jgi:4'-phosphopantetheinyl transferase
MSVGSSCDEIHLIFSRLTAEKDFLDQLRQMLSPDEKERARLFRFDEHRNSFIVSRGLLRIILGKWIGAESLAIRFIYSSRGKPAVPNSHRVRFNLSHSGDFVVYALAMGQELGVDVELIRPVENMEDMAQHSFSAEECRELSTVPHDRRTKAFFDCWTRKEAFIKAIGHGLLYPLDRFQVTLLPDEPAGFVSINGRPGSETQWSLHDVSPVKEYAAALAVERRSSRIRAWKFESPVECARFYR